MKNYLSIGVIALLFALTFGTVKPVQAIAGYGWLLDRPPVNNSQLVVSMAGIVEGTDKKVFINFFEIDLTSQPAHGGKTEQGLSPKSKPFATNSSAMPHKLEKADLLKAIQERLIANVHSNDGYFEVIDFASDATITDRNGKVYFADKDDSVTLPTQPVQEFLLRGHVRVRPYKEKPIQTPAKSVDVRYTVQFTPLNPDDDFRPVLKNTKLLKTLAIGGTVTSQELLAQAQSILNESHPDYTIYERDSSIVTHDNDIFRTILPMDQEFTYHIKDREQAYGINKKSGQEEKTNNTDLISEKYYVLKKGEKPYDPFDRSHLKLFTINYVDVNTNKLLKSEQLLTASERNLDFRDLYDPRDKAKLLYNNLDAFGIMDYTLTGKVEDNHDKNNRVVTVYMGKRPEGENASYHLAYDKDRYTEEEREVYSYLRYTGTPIPDNPKDK
ncbi:kinase [Streptococcus pyogenes JRS4]|uniref:Streptokinase n=3 Tax=Streptococcus pyogenes TaxID=1314 RepID=Q7X0Y7_STRPY|nr:streptokinase [Streptococcus pyogenes]ESA46385.1 staphylokinase/streptokinase family protein [Streptococcus pyogenes GA41039]ESA51762.1 staphylokinase/streptokinase family protein [Streptococcus pyogenes GA19700]HER4585483.1 streptokinase [Streptococcus pyogenes NGAS618]HER4612593.1 streptokinase [Streptococcus pyogenes NGAS603]HER4744329.1 streptokinase [Streptococcus pyogenes NGAS289]HER4749437.1 streptokinase [Streptococcus pyogenes NGAS287]HER4765120.1 streptokinase [Streptococcus pyo